MDSFSKTAIWVLPTGNALPTTGSTENLNVGQVGVFKDDARTAATAGNISTADFIQVAQGRDKYDSRGSKYSGRIDKARVKKYYKVVGSGSAAVEIGQFSGFSARCGETLSLTLRGFSSYLETISYNGFERSLVIETPCCDCGANPCDIVDNETIIDLFIDQARNINKVQNLPNSLNINTYWVFEKIGSGNEAVLKITGKPLTSDGKFCDISLNPYEYDRMWFRAWAYRQPDTTVDHLVYDECDQVATWTYLQRSTYVQGTYDQVYQDEIDYNSYLSPQKFDYTNPAFNQWFESYATPGTIYDQYYIIFNDLDEEVQWNAYIPQDTTVILAVPQALSSGLEAVLSPYLGTVINKSGTIPTTSTTTSTTTTSTSSTTIFVP